MLLFNINQFIKENVINRKESLFHDDLQNNLTELRESIQGKSILVIGGAGTIGSSYIKALLPYEPASLTVVDQSENGLTELTRDLRSDNDVRVPPIYLSYPFDFGSDTFRKLFSKNHYDIIACFAAHKHVRSEKDHFAIEAMIRNNVFNTQRLIDLALEHPPNHFFSVSTDKAANPVNIMGASKKVMENVILSHANMLKVSTARFANVAFSNGSLLAGFLERMAKRQPFSSPKDVKRYFVSPQESGQLCLIASVLGKTGDIFFPKLKTDQMLSFSVIAEKLLFQHGYKPDYCISEQEAKEKAKNWSVSESKYPVYFFETDTSGEKMLEEFYTPDDHIDNNKFSQLGIIKSSKLPSRTSVQDILQKLEKQFSKKQSSKSEIVQLLSSYLDDFKHIEKGKNLDDKM